MADNPRHDSSKLFYDDSWDEPGKCPKEWKGIEHSIGEIIPRRVLGYWAFDKLDSEPVKEDDFRTVRSIILQRLKLSP